MNRRGVVQRGFTLIELTIVIVVLAAFGAVALLRYQPADSGVGYQADRLARDIRHMQMLALTWGMTLRLVPSATGYYVRCASGSATTPCNGAGAVTDPADGQPFQYSPLDNGVTLDVKRLAVNLANFDIDSLGRPVVSGVVDTANSIFTLTGGAKTPVVTVLPLTGFVSVVY